MYTSNLHNDEHSNEHRKEASPGDPRYLLELAHASARSDHECCNDGKVVRAKRVLGQGVECCGDAHHARCTDDDEGNEEENSCDLFYDLSTNELAHVGNGMAAWMVVAELALDERAPCVQSLPSEDVDRTWEGTERVHGGWDGQHSSCEDHWLLSIHGVL